MDCSPPFYAQEGVGVGTFGSLTNHYVFPSCDRQSSRLDPVIVDLSRAHLQLRRFVPGSIRGHRYAGRIELATSAFVVGAVLLGSGYRLLSYRVARGF